MGWRVLSVARVLANAATSARAAVALDPLADIGLQSPEDLLVSLHGGGQESCQTLGSEVV